MQNFVHSDITSENHPGEETIRFECKVKIRIYQFFRLRKKKHCKFNKNLKRIRTYAQFILDITLKIRKLHVWFRIWKEPKHCKEYDLKICLLPSWKQSTSDIAHQNFWYHVKNPDIMQWVVHLKNSNYYIVQFPVSNGTISHFCQKISIRQKNDEKRL